MVAKDLKQGIIRIIITTCNTAPNSFFFSPPKKYPTSYVVDVTQPPKRIYKKLFWNKKITTKNVTYGSRLWSLWRTWTTTLLKTLGPTNPSTKQSALNERFAPDIPKVEQSDPDLQRGMGSLDSFGGCFFFNEGAKSLGWCIFKFTCKMSICVVKLELPFTRFLFFNLYINACLWCLNQLGF